MAMSKREYEATRYPPYRMVQCALRLSINCRKVSKEEHTYVGHRTLFLTFMGKCIKGFHMNWVKYLVNQLDLDCDCKAQDQG
jgi:hypothetical protein